MQVPHCRHWWADPSSWDGGHGWGCRWWQGMGSNVGWKGSRLQGYPSVCVQGCTQHRSLSTTSPGMGPVNFSVFFLLFHLPPTASSICSIFSRYSEVREGGKSAGECRGGDAGGTALGSCSLPSCFGSRSSFPWDLNSTRHKRGQISSHTSANDKVGEAWRTLCPHPPQCRFPPVNGNSQSPPRAAITPWPVAEGVFPSMGSAFFFLCCPLISSHTAPASEAAPKEELQIT